jgi:transcriptional regulator with XRE-family HTH domain
MPETTLGSRIAGRRRMLKRSQEDVAREVGVSQRYLSKLENDDGRPSWDVAMRLRSALRVTMDFLADGDE